MSHIPVLQVYSKTLPGAWEQAVKACWNEGAKISTEYDREEHPPSRDCTMIMVVENPYNEPRIHRAMPCGLEDLEVYRQEVLFGIHDDWADGEGEHWRYTYHSRLMNYDLPGLAAIDQIESALEKLAEAPHTRRAQAVTWQVWSDVFEDDPPCLQRLWFRILDNRLHMNVHIRSNDAFKAAFMNMFAFSALQGLMAGRLHAKTGEDIFVGQYVHMADSFHIYGKDFSEFEKFLETLEKREWEDRTWTTAQAEPHFQQARFRLVGEAREKSNG